jgi:hypothetical protein
MLGRIVAVISIVSSIVLIVLLHTTAPTTIGPLGILMVFILMYLSALGMLTFLIYEGRRLLSKMLSYRVIKRTISQWSIGRSYYYASIIALAPVMFVGMQSVGEVGAYDVLLLMLFLAIACVYITKRTR